MSLITQGKTNLTYLLIIIILAIIVGGGILFYYYSWIADLDARLAQIELKLPEEKAPAGINPRDFGARCEITTTCNDLVEIDCGAAVDGPLYYVDVTSKEIVGRCGGLCMGGGCDLTKCPPKEWTCESELYSR